jgi:hypothetical protein
MRRRKFITLIGGLAAAWPLAALGQPTKKMPKVGVLWHAGSADQEAPYFGSLLEGSKASATSMGETSSSSIASPTKFQSDSRAWEPNLYR